MEGYNALGHRVSLLNEGSKPRPIYPPPLPRVNRTHPQDASRRGSSTSTQSGTDTVISSRSERAESSRGSPIELNQSSKRYQCRYQERFQCSKTFTTLGHASRHSKIHVAARSIACTFPGCTKKFTRADNMKQHILTHSGLQSYELAVKRTRQTVRRTRPKKNNHRLK